LWRACGLLLVACGLKFIKKFLRALQVRLRQLAMVHREPGQQVVVFNSFHLSKYILYYPSEHVKLEACCLLLEAWPRSQPRYLTELAPAYLTPGPSSQHITVYVGWPVIETRAQGGSSASQSYHPH